MERLCSPCTRLLDMIDGQLRLLHLEGRPKFLRELNLDVSTEEFLSAERAFTYADLCAMLGSGVTVAWLTPHAATFLEDERVEQSWMQMHIPTCHLNFNADGKDIVVRARFHEEDLLEICHVIVRLLAASVVYSVHQKNC
jgi:hypothetical protein